MSLQTTVENAVTSAFDAAGDLVGSFTHISRTKSFDVDTNSNTISEITTEDIDGIFDNIKDGVFNSNIQAGDRVLYLKPGSYTVKTDDRIIDPNSVEWRVVEPKAVAPSGKILLHMLHVTS